MQTGRIHLGESNISAAPIKIWKHLPPDHLCGPSVFHSERRLEGGGGSKTTCPYSEGRPGVLGAAPGPWEDGGAPASSGCQSGPPERPIIPGCPEGIRNIILFQVLEDLQAKGERAWLTGGFLSTPTGSRGSGMLLSQPPFANITWRPS